jgi:hypothetical protein
VRSSGCAAAFHLQREHWTGRLKHHFLIRYIPSLSFRASRSAAREIGQILAIPLADKTGCVGLPYRVSPNLAMFWLPLLSPEWGVTKVATGAALAGAR